MEINALIDTLHARTLCIGSAAHIALIALTTLVAPSNSAGGRGEFEINPPTPTTRFDCIPDDGLKVVMS